MADDAPTPGAPSGPGQPPGGGDRREPTLGDFFWLGTGCAICVVGGGGLGYAIDSATGWTPWATFAGLAFGVVSAVLLAVKQVRRFL